MPVALPLGCGVDEGTLMGRNERKSQKSIRIYAPPRPPWHEVDVNGRKGERIKEKVYESW